MPPAPSGGARKKGTGGEGASDRWGRSERPHATRIMRENTPSSILQWRTPICGMARDRRLRFQAKNLLIRAIHGE